MGSTSTPTMRSRAVTAADGILTQKPRIESIDIMRGLVMVTMALDHARDFYHADAALFDPTDLTKTTPFLFFTRFITHFCAPTFVLLAGSSVRIRQQRRSKAEMSSFLLTRGLWLILLEMTLIRFGLFFQWYYDVTLFQVIWAIGICMVLLAGLIRLPFNAILILGIVITAGHNILDAVTLKPGDPFAVLWMFTHQAGLMPLTNGHAALVPYPFLPWLGIMLLGYCMGEWYTSGFDASRRRKLLRRTGLSALLLFIVLRSFNLYGDPVAWSAQKDLIYTMLSFINVTKYPVSLLYTLLMLGPVLILLAWLEKPKPRWLNPFLVVGRVPLFYYVPHFYLLHAGALALYLMRSGRGFSELDFHFNAGLGGIPPGAGYPLIAAYIAWVAVVIILYPLCKAYNAYKSAHKDWWLSYI